jgi:hypothetical protein
MDTYDRIALLEEAQGLLKEALDLIRQAVRDTPIENSAESYLIPHLAMRIDDHHEYLGREQSVAELIAALREDGADDEDD